MMMMIMIMPPETDRPSDVADVTRRLAGEQRRDLERRRNGDPGESRILLVLFDTFDTLFISHLP